MWADPFAASNNNKLQKKFRQIHKVNSPNTTSAHSLNCFAYKNRHTCKQKKSSELGGIPSKRVSKRWAELGRDSRKDVYKAESNQKEKLVASKNDGGPVSPLCVCTHIWLGLQSDLGVHLVRFCLGLRHRCRDTGREKTKS
jgi:hypothetical protein